MTTEPGATLVLMAILKGQVRQQASLPFVWSGRTSGLALVDQYICLKWKRFGGEKSLYAMVIFGIRQFLVAILEGCPPEVISRLFWAQRPCSTRMPVTSFKEDIQGDCTMTVTMNDNFKYWIFMSQVTLWNHN